MLEIVGDAHREAHEIWIARYERNRKIYLISQDDFILKLSSIPQKAILPIVVLVAFEIVTILIAFESKPVATKDNRRA